MRLRKGDLDHIVDELSDNEGDEDAAVHARAEMELREDKEHTRRVITAVTEGHDTLKNKSKKSGYSFEHLVGGKKNIIVDNNTEAVEEEEEMDEEEMLQRGLQEKLERDRRSRARRGSDNESDDDGDEDEDMQEDEIDMVELLGKEIKLT